MNTTDKLTNYFYSLGTDDAGDVYTGGLAGGTPFLGDSLMFSSTDDNTLKVDWRYRVFFTNKYDKDGVLLNTFFESKSDRTHESVLIGVPRDIEIDSEDNVYSFDTDVGNIFGVFPFTNDTTLLVSANLIVKFDQSGFVGPFVGISEENNSLAGLTIYPNPIISNIIISTEYLNDDLLLFDFTGRLIRIIALTEIHTIIDVENMDAGIYFLKLLENSTLRASKVIIE